jgi:hypothetical protein
MKLIKTSYSQYGTGMGPEGLVYGDSNTGKKVIIPLNRIKQLFNSYISITDKMSIEEFTGLKWIASLWDDPEFGPEIKQYLTGDQTQQQAEQQQAEQQPTNDPKSDLAQQMDQAMKAGEWNTVRQLKNQLKGMS